MARVLALVTNDDGIDAHGLRMLAEVTIEAGLDVLIAAPHREYSGQGAALSALEEGGRLIHRERDWDGPRGAGSIRMLSVEASPAMIAMIASRGGLGTVPDVVLSGINHGPNTGHLVLHSGTVNAVLTGAYHGISGLAVSMNAMKPEHWPTAQVATRPVLGWLLGRAAGRPVVSLSLNAPDIPGSELRGIRQARLSDFGAVQAEIREVGASHTTLTFRRETPEPEPGTDHAALRDGYASLAALRGPSEVAMDFGALVS
jgi:5'-nucleotidase